MKKRCVEKSTFILDVLKDVEQKNQIKCTFQIRISIQNVVTTYSAPGADIPLQRIFIEIQARYAPLVSYFDLLL